MNLVRQYLLSVLFLCLPTLLFSQVTFEKVYSEFPEVAGGLKVDQTSDHGYLVGALIYSEISDKYPGTHSLFLLKTDNKGNIEFSSKIEGSSLSVCILLIPQK